VTSTNPTDHGTNEDTIERARLRLSSTGRNDPCPCGSNKKYKKCHLGEDQAIALAPPKALDPEEILMNGWRLFEQHRPGAAEKTFRQALDLRPAWADAYAGIGLSCLQVGNSDGARQAFNEVERISGPLAGELRATNVKDAFTRKETQAYVRSCHALGCMAFDEKNYDETLAKLELVYSIDEGPVGTEARLITGIALLKQNRAADAVAILEPATKSEAGMGRASMSLALAKFLAGNSAEAETALEVAQKTNPHFAKAILGRGPRRQANFSAATPGSLEEALGYAQTYGDAWEASAKAFLEDYLQKQPKLKKTATTDRPPE
jgi:tetratricopeptide (TPR) repeat protein